MEIFFKNEKRYLNWCKQNKYGFVFNFFIRSSYEGNALHRVNCIHLWYAHHEGRRTTSKKKICSNNIDELIKKAKELSGNNWFPCKTCKPLKKNNPGKPRTNN